MKICTFDSSAYFTVNICGENLFFNNIIPIFIKQTCPLLGGGKPADPALLHQADPEPGPDGPAQVALPPGQGRTFQINSSANLVIFVCVWGGGDTDLGFLS